MGLDPLEVMARRAEFRRDGDARVWWAQIHAAGGPLAAWGRWVHAHRGWVLVMSLALVTASAGLYARGGTMQAGSLIGGTQSNRADQLIRTEQSHTLGASAFQLVLRDDRLSLPPPIPAPAALVAALLMLASSAAGWAMVLAQRHFEPTITIPARDLPDLTALVLLLTGTLAEYVGLLGVATAVGVWSIRLMASLIGRRQEHGRSSVPAG